MLDAFDRLVATFSDHVMEISQGEQLTELMQQGRLFIEQFECLPSAFRASQWTRTDDLSPIRLLVDQIRSSVKGGEAPVPLPSESSSVHETSMPSKDKGPSNLASRLLLVWESKVLTERDLGIPSGATTHPTGSINLDKGQLEPYLDHRHYFREHAFGTLEWTPNAKGVEHACAAFDLIIKGAYHGVHELTIAHTVGTETASYLQHNAMTRLRWGSAGRHLKRRDLLGRTMKLFRCEHGAADFAIVID